MYVVCISEVGLDILVPDMLFSRLLGVLSD